MQRYLEVMYQPPAFRENHPEILRAVILAHPLATLVTHGGNGLQANLLPFVLDVGERGEVLRGHLAKANGQIDDLRSDAEALIIFQGPQAYISPSWYPSKKETGKVVPTWNYVVVQVRGKAKVIDDPAWLLAQVRQLTAQQEVGQPDPWAVTDAPEAFISSQLKGISGVEIAVDRMEGKWKVSQNQPAANKAGVIGGLRTQDPSSVMADIVAQLSG